MTDDKKALAIVNGAANEVDKAYGSREELGELKSRLSLIPGSEKLNDGQKAAFAQYSRARQADPFRGELYAYTDKKGNLKLVDGYKLLVREAKKISGYDDTYTMLTPEEREAEAVPEGAIAVYCRLLRDDERSKIGEYTKLGASFQEALDIVSTKTVGVVLAKEMSGQYGPIDPPKGWSWAQVGRKRALKGAINFTYPLPSPYELAQRQMVIDGVQTIEEDWVDAEKYDHPWQREEAAKLEAHQREWQAEWNQMSREEQRETAAANIELMRDDDDGEDPAASVYGIKCDDADFDTDFGDDAAELGPVEVEEAQETPPPVRLEAMGYDDFIKEVHEANRGKKLTSARLEIATRKILAQEFPAIYKTDDDVTQAAGKALGGIIDKTAAFSTGQKAHEVYVLARDYAAGLDATK